MLVLNRLIDESIVIDDDIEVTIISIKGVLSKSVFMHRAIEKLIAVKFTSSVNVTNNWKIQAHAFILSTSCLRRMALGIAWSSLGKL